MKMSMEELVNYCKNYGFIYQGSEIYGGLANTWDFGPVGMQLKNNIKNVMSSFIEFLVNEGYGILFIPQLYGESNDYNLMKKYLWKGTNISYSQ